LDVSRLTGTALPASIQISTSNIPNGTVVAADLAANLDFAGKTINLPTNTTINSANTVGGIVYGATTSQLNQLSAGTAGQILVSAGTGLAPVWALDHKGVTDNSNAPSGYVGQFVSSVLTKVNGIVLPTGTPTSITSIYLTEGDWDIRGQVDYTCGNATTQIQIAIQGTSLTNNAFSDGQDTYSTLNLGASTFNQGTTIDMGLPIKTRRLSIGSPQTIYLVAQANFTGTSASVKGYGTIEARRMR
jgi:hypothetical protein